MSIISLVGGRFAGIIESLIGGFKFPDASILTSASPSIWQRKSPYISCDFFNSSATQPPWTGTAASSGTLGIGSLAQLTNRPGVVIANSSTTANSGYSFVTSNTFVLKGGEFTSLLAAPSNNGSTTSFRFGFGDFSSAVVAAANGAYFEITNNSAKGVTASASVRTNTASSFTFTADTFYHFVIETNANATAVTFSIYAEAGGAPLWQETNTGTIPTSALFHGWRASNSGTTALALIAVDFMDVNNNLPSIRGRSA